MITYWPGIFKKCNFITIEVTATFATFHVMTQSLRIDCRRKFCGSAEITILILVIMSLRHVKLEIKNRMLCSEYQLI